MTRSCMAAATAFCSAECCRAPAMLMCWPACADGLVQLEGTVLVALEDVAKGYRHALLHRPSAQCCTHCLLVSADLA